MPYQIWIGTTKAGAPLIGARACAAAERRDDLDATAHVYPSQLAYRVTARMQCGSMAVCTRTEAREYGWTVVGEFPRANGSLSAR